MTIRLNEFKNLQTQGLTLMGPALKHTFDVLNINRMQTGIDTYGQVSLVSYGNILVF